MDWKDPDFIALFCFPLSARIAGGAWKIVGLIYGWQLFFDFRIKALLSYKPFAFYMCVYIES